jgi:hypothetical protein
MTRTLVVDYGQNVAMPWFGESQPSEVYYYTPLNVYNLGIVNTSHYEDPNPPEKLPLDRMYAHLYHEGQVAKGGDNRMDESNPG